MSRPRVRLERLEAHHDVRAFDSGNEELDGWLDRHALVAQHMDSARTFVLTGHDRIVGYFSLTMGSVLRQDAPAKLVRGMPAYPIGMVLLARLAVDRRDQGTGVRRALARGGASQGGRRRRGSSCSPARCRRNRRRGGHFYQRYGFVPHPNITFVCTDA